MCKRLFGLAAFAVLAHAQTTRQRAEQAFDGGRYDEAVQLFEKDYKETSRCQALFGLGLAHYRLHQGDAALIAFQSSVQCDSKLTLAYIAMAEAYSERNNIKEALSAYLQALNLDPRNAAALQGTASIYLRQESPQKAVELLETLVKVAPLDPQAHADLGAGYFATGNQEGAAQQFKEALRLRPNDATALLGLANIYVRNGEGDQAIAALQKTVKLQPKAYAPHFLLGSTYNRQGRYQEAVDELQKAIQLGSQDSEVYYHLARAYGSLGKAEDRSRALAKFTELTRKTKANTEAQRQSGKLVEDARSLVDAGNLKAAAALLEQARELQPADDGLLFRLASVHYDLQQVDVARADAEEAISLAPSVWLYHYLLGLIDMQKKSWQKARASLQTAAQLNPSAKEVKEALLELSVTEAAAKN